MDSWNYLGGLFWGFNYFVAIFKVAVSEPEYDFVFAVPVSEL